MTIARNHMTRGSSTSAAPTTASFTPTANSLLVLIFACEANAPGVTSDSTPTFTATGYTFTQRQQQSSGPTGVYSIQTGIYTAPVGSSPSSVTINLDNDITPYRWVWEVCCLTNVDGSSPVIGSGGSDSESGNPGTMNATLSSAPESNSHAIGVIALDTNNAGRVGAASGYTEINENSSDYPLFNVCERTGSTSTAAAWTVTSFSGEGSGGSCCAVAFRHASAGNTYSGAAAFTGAGTMAAAATRTAFGTSTFAGVGTFAAAGAKTTSGAAAFSGAGTFTAAGTRIALGATSFAGTGTFTAAASVAIGAQASFAGAGTMSAAATRVAVGSATFTGTGTFTAAAPVLVARAAATLAGAGTMSAAAIRTTYATAALSGTGAFTAAGVRQVTATAGFAGAGTFAAAGTRVALGASTFAGVGTFTAAGTRIAYGAAAFAGAGTWAVVAATPGIQFVGLGTVAEESVGTGPLTVPLPSGVVAGDLLIMQAQSRVNEAGATIDIPSGWVDSGLGTVAYLAAHKSRYFIRVAGSSEGSASLTGTLNGAPNNLLWARISAWRGVNPVVWSDATPVSSTSAAAATGTSNAITTVTDGAMVVTFSTTNDDNTLSLSTPGSFSDGYRIETTTAGDASMAMAYRKVATAGTSGTCTWTQTVNGTDNWTFATLALRPLVQHLGAAAFTGAGTFAVAATRRAFGVAPFTGIATFTAAAIRRAFAAAGFTGTGTFTAAGNTGPAVITGQATFTGTGTFTAAGTVPERIYLFRPPTRNGDPRSGYNKRHAAYPLMRHYGYVPAGINIYQLTNGTITETPPRWGNLIAKVWQGGHDHTVTLSEAVQLAAAGYTVEGYTP